MRFFRPTLIALCVLVLSGCYHARIETGRPASATVIDRPFASSWVYGLVPPSTVNAAAQCPDGVAVVETRLSFVNQLVGALTFGIYTPMHIKVTCAAAGSAALPAGAEPVAVAPEASAEEVVAAFHAAADQAVIAGQPVYVQFP